MTARVLIGLLLAAIALSACTNDAFDPASLDNRPPIARIFVDHADSLATTSYNEARFAWSGTDADGFVVGFWVSITTQDDPDAPWIFTTDDDTLATWTTREDGTVVPTLHVVAVDDRGALSDTARTAFPLVNSPPVLEYAEEYEPPMTSFAAADFDLFTFDPDGDETLLPIVEYRYAGSDPSVVFDLDDPEADPAVGWVTLERERRGFRLRLRDIPSGDPDQDEQQTVFVRVRDDAGAATVLEYTWTVPEIRGPVLLVDDDDSEANSRDAFFRDTMNVHFGDAWNVIESTSLRGEPEVLAASLEPFGAIIWYVRAQGRGANIDAVHEALESFLNDGGKLYLDFQYVGAPANTSQLNDAFRIGFLKVTANPFEGQIFSPAFVQAETGPELDILSNDPVLPDLIYTGSEGTFFDLWPIGLPSGTGDALYRFEAARWSARCRPTCEPVVATRYPATGEAQIVNMSMQLDFTDDLEQAQQVLRTIWSAQMGLAAVSGGAAPGEATR